MMMFIFFMLGLFLNVYFGFFYTLIYYIFFMMFFFVFFNSIYGLLMNYSFFMLDSCSFSLIFLSIWVSILMVLSSYKIYKNSNSDSIFSLMVVLLMFILYVTFMVDKFFIFYFFFESSLIPTFIIIMGWGYQPERLQAGIYFLFYTLFSSLPLLMFILGFLNSHFFYSFFMSDLIVFGVGHFIKVLFLIMSVLAFLVKFPMFFFHLWLPKAHVEAPVAGSMILAGVLLKLGGYGIIRVVSMFTDLSLVSSFMVGLSLLGMCYVGFICCRLNDLKSLVAYSSVAHMALIICGLFTFSCWGFNGALMMMIAHGLSSSGLFCMANIYYERLGSRSFYLNKGMILIYPIFSMMFFMLCVSNISGPPSINLISEIFLMSSVLSYDYFMILVFPLGSFLGTVFTIYMYSYSQHGKIYDMIYSYSVANFREIHILLMHIVPVNFVILFPFYFISFV